MTKSVNTLSIYLTAKKYNKQSTMIWKLKSSSSWLMDNNSLFTIKSKWCWTVRGTKVFLLWISNKCTAKELLMKKAGLTIWNLWNNMEDLKIRMKTNTHLKIKQIQMQLTYRRTSLKNDLISRQRRLVKARTLIQTLTLLLQAFILQILSMCHMLWEKVELIE